MHRNLLENDNLGDKEGKTEDPMEKGSRDRRRMELVQDRVTAVLELRIPSPEKGAWI
jgi:hypothetical protein